MAPADGHPAMLVHQLNSAAARADLGRGRGGERVGKPEGMLAQGGEMGCVG